MINKVYHYPAWTDAEKLAARERLGISPSIYAFEVLAKGIIPAETITGLGEGNSYFDTGITLGKLREYKVFNLMYRCDASQQYYGFVLKENKIQSRLIYSITNGICASSMWIDDAKTAIWSSATVGNVFSPIPTKPQTMDNWTTSKIPASNAGSGMIGYSDENIRAMTNDAKLYAGVFHMNSKSTNTKDISWAVCGVIK